MANLYSVCFSRKDFTSELMFIVMVELSRIGYNKYTHTTHTFLFLYKIQHAVVVQHFQDTFLRYVFNECLFNLTHHKKMM